MPPFSPSRNNAGNIWKTPDTRVEPRDLISVHFVNNSATVGSQPTEPPRPPPTNMRSDVLSNVMNRTGVVSGKPSCNNAPFNARREYSTHAPMLPLRSNTNVITGKMRSRSPSSFFVKGKTSVKKVKLRTTQKKSVHIPIKWPNGPNDLIVA